MEADKAGAALQQLLEQLGRPLPVVGGFQTAALRRGAFHYVGEADAMVKKHGVVGGGTFAVEGWGQQMGTVEGRPEAVAGVGEVVALARRVFRGVQPDEDQGEARAEQVG